MIRVKICGITNLADAQAAVAAGADALGFVFYPKSPRYVDPETVRQIISHIPPFVTMVGLFVNEQHDLVETIVEQSGVDRIQLHGDELPNACSGFSRPVIKAIRVKDDESLHLAEQYQVASFILDAWSPNHYGGTGERFDWTLAEKFCQDHHVILAGGLTPEVVAEAVKSLPLYGVDVSSGVEDAPGIKNHDKMNLFVKNAKGAHG